MRCLRETADYGVVEPNQIGRVNFGFRLFRFLCIPWEMNRRLFIVGLLGVAGASFAAEKIYHYRCPSCGRVEPSDKGGETLYCEGTRGKRHSKTTMQRMPEKKRVFHYKCPTCPRVVPSDKGGETLYCVGTEKKPHTRTTMRRID